MSHTAYICNSHTDTCGNIPIDILTRAIDRSSREVSLFPESGREPSRRKMNNLTISRTHTHTLCIYTATGMRNYYFIYFENVRVGWGESKLRCEGARVRVSLRLRVRVTLRDRFTIARELSQIAMPSPNTHALQSPNVNVNDSDLLRYTNIRRFEDMRYVPERNYWHLMDGPGGNAKGSSGYVCTCLQMEWKIFFIVLMDGKHEALRRYLHLLAKGGKFSIDGKHEALRRCLHLLAQPVPIGRLMILVVWFSGSFSSRHHRLWKFTTFSISGGPSSNFSRRQKIFLWTSGKIV